MKDLHQLLRNWAERSEPTPVQWDELRQSTMAAIESSVGHRDSLLNSSTQTGPDQRVATRRGLGAMVVALVASLMVGVWFWRFAGTQENSVSLGAIDNFASRPTNQQPLFTELDRLFDGHWRWWSEINGRVNLQTAELNTSSNEPGVAVRLSVLCRRPGQKNWTVVWEASVLSHTDEWVRLPIESMAGDSVCVWCHALSDGSVVVENEMRLTNPVSLQLAEPHVFEDLSQSARLWFERRADGDFQLIQSIARLEGNHG